MGRVGFGCWQIGGPMVTVDGRVNGYAAISERDAVATLQYAYQRGIRFFDTASAYGRGRSESLLGQAFRDAQDPPIICSKFGFKEDASRAYSDFSAAHLQQSLEDTLRRLGRERLDILLLHNPPDDFAWDEYDPAPFERLVAAGKLGAFGVSCRSLRGAARVLRAGFGTVIEAIYNALDRRAEDGVLDQCLAQGVQFVARVPLASGYLTSKGLAGPIAHPAEDIRSTLPSDVVGWFRTQVQRLEFLEPLEGGITTSAIRFALSHPGVSYVIPGMRSPAQVDAALLAERLGTLDGATRRRVAQAVPEVYPGWR